MLPLIRGSIGYAGGISAWRRYALQACSVLYVYFSWLFFPFVFWMKNHYWLGGYGGNVMKIFELTCDDLGREMRRGYGKGDYHARALYKSVFQKGRVDLGAVEEFQASKDLGKRVAKDLVLSTGKTGECIHEDATTKFVTILEDGQRVESVIIPMRGYSTLCVSSQVGCRQGCLFCETGTMGLVRNLSTEEIVSQVWRARFELGYPVRNVVFMGMGEALDNVTHVAQAIRVMQDQRGLDIPLRRMTLSTAGRIDGLARLASLGLGGIRLAISLNAANDALRSRIMPVNRRFPLAELKQALLNYPLPANREFLIEYVVFKGLNHSQAHADEVLSFVRDLPVRVNIIGYNPGKNALFEPPAEQDLQVFSEYLQQHGINTRIRWSKGRSIMAGCGQLASAKPSC